jgi:phosphatidylinositol alpha-mannosyltransferase
MADLGPDVRLWVGSNGPDTERLTAQTAADPRIEWLGRLTDEEKISRLRGADVFCAPSLRGESFGVVLIEAMAAGTCIVASALDGYQNVATDGRDALLVPPGDPGALAVALQKALGDGSLSDRLIVAGASRAEDFSMVTLATRYAEIYRQVARPAEAPRAISPWPLSPRLRRRPRMMA